LLNSDCTKLAFERLGPGGAATENENPHQGHVAWKKKGATLKPVEILSQVVLQDWIAFLRMSAFNCRLSDISQSPFSLNSNSCRLLLVQGAEAFAGSPIGMVFDCIFAGKAVPEKLRYSVLSRGHLP
jgi:hypothetical protein